MISLKYSAIIVALILMDVACARPQPNYCGSATDHNCVDIGMGALDAGGTDSTLSCGGSAGCGDKVCDMSSGACVQCTASNSGACTLTTPVCGSDDMCHACAAHKDCLSQVCLPTGACAADGDVAYVVAYKPPGTGCTQANPCGTLSEALTKPRPYIKIGIGTIIDSGVVIDGNPSQRTKVTILADPGGGITADNGAAVLTIQGASDIDIYDLEITGSDDTGEGIHMASVGSAAPSVHLVHTKVDNLPKIGINVMGGNITIERSSIFANKGGGIKVFSGVFDISSSLIYRNGDPATPTNGSIGGLSLSPASNSNLRFNTIVDNFANASADGGGVLCFMNTASKMSSSYNILWRNQLSGSSTNPQISSFCSFPNSFLNNGNGNIAKFKDPNESDPNKDDYHLTTSSPTTVVDAVTVVGDCTGVDLDGNTRRGQTCDYGAYERKP